jgi:hypothetical protein
MKLGIASLRVLQLLLQLLDCRLALHKLGMM